MSEKKARASIRQRTFEIIEVGKSDDYVSRAYDFVSMFAIVVNLVASILYTFNEFSIPYGPTLLMIERITIGFFAFELFLRLLTAKCMYPKLSEGRALLKYLTSYSGLIDLCTVLPYYLPIFFPTGITAFRMVRVVRIFRLFRINAYYDSVSVIADVITGKKQQLISSVFMISILMLFSSLCMYTLENAAQPDVFTNAFSGIWWAVSTLLTVGYGDIFPITTLGRIFAICITFLGVGMVAIPTGIISAGFVDQYSRIKRMNEYVATEDIHFIKVHLSGSDPWIGQSIQTLGLPHGVLVAVIQRKGKVLVPRGNTILQEEDTIVLGAESFNKNEHIDLKEIILRKHSYWVGQKIRDLDISRQSIILMVKRKGKVLIPKGDLVMQEGDKVVMYTELHMSNAQNIQI